MSKADPGRRSLFCVVVITALALAAFGHCAVPWTAMAHAPTDAHTQDASSSGHADHDEPHCNAGIYAVPTSRSASSDTSANAPGMVARFAFERHEHSEGPTRLVTKPETRPRLWLFLLHASLLI